MNSDEFESEAEQLIQDELMQEVYGIEIGELDMLEFEDYTNLAPINDSHVFDDSDYMVELIEDYNFKLA